MTTSRAQLQFSSDNVTEKAANIRPTCRDWKNEPDDVLWSGLVKGEIIVDLQKFHCKATPSLCQNNTVVDICIGCNNRVRFGSQTKPLVFTHPINIGDEAWQTVPKVLFLPVEQGLFHLAFKQTKQR